MSKSGEAFEKLTYEEIRSMTLKEVGEWLWKHLSAKELRKYIEAKTKFLPTGKEIVMASFSVRELESLKRGEMPK